MSFGNYGSHVPFAPFAERAEKRGRAIKARCERCGAPLLRVKRFCLPCYDVHSQQRNRRWHEARNAATGERT